MKVLIIRHAQSTNNVLLELDRESERVQDPEITELGLTQAQSLGELLAALPLPGMECARQVAWRPGVIFTSLMLRAAHTTHILAQHTGAEIEGWVDLHEVGGIYLYDQATDQKRGLPGATREVLARRFPSLRLPDAVGAEGWWNRPFETEPAPIVARAERVARRLLELAVLPENARRTLGLMTHGGFYGYLLPKLLHVPELGWLHAEMNNTGCTLLELEPAETRLVFHNSLRHLSFDSIT